MQRTIHLVALLIGILAPFARPASLPINTDVVEKSVVFLYYPRDNQGNSEAGTGFFVEIPLKSDPEHVHWAIVTARHLVDPQWAGCSWPNPHAITLRVNTADYKSGKDRKSTRLNSSHL